MSLNLGPMKEQLVLLTSELSLQPLVHHAITVLDLLVNKMAGYLFIYLFMFINLLLIFILQICAFCLHVCLCPTVSLVLTEVRRV